MWRRVLLALLVLGTLPLAFAANDPGHDSLYVLLLGDSNVTGSINITQNLTAQIVRFTSKAFGDYLDIVANGTVLGAPSQSRIMGASSALYIDSTGNLYLNTKGGTTGIVQIGDTATNGVTLNVSGNILQQNVAVCLANGTNCIGGNNTGNVSSVTAGDGLTDSGTLSDPILDVGAGDGISVDANSVSVDATVCRQDGSNCPAGVTPTAGWINTTQQVYLANNATNVSVGWVNSQAIMFIDTTSGKIGVGARASELTAHGQNLTNVFTTLKLGVNHTETGIVGGDRVTALFNSRIEPTANTYSISPRWKSLEGYIYVPSTNTNTISTIIGVEADAENYGGRNVTEITGLLGWGYNAQDTNVTQIQGASLWAESDAGNVANLRGAWVETWMYGGTITNLSGIFVDKMEIGGGTVTNRYGIFISVPSGSATNDYGIYQAGSAQNNYLAGNLSIGSSSVTGRRLEVVGTINATAIQVGTTNVCLSDGTNCPGGSGGGGGWTNSSTQVWLYNNATNVSVGNTTDNQPVLFIDTKNGAIGIGNAAPYPTISRVLINASKISPTDPDVASFLYYRIAPSANLDAGSYQTASTTYAEVPQTNTKTVGNLLGGDFEAINQGPGNVSSLTGIFGWAANRNITNITSLTGGYIGSENTAGSLGTQYGLVIANFHSGSSLTTRYGLLISTPTGTATNDYGIYQLGSAQNNYFAGNISVGNTSVTDRRLQVFGTVNATAIQVGTTDVCLSDGTNCPAATGDGAYNVTYETGIANLQTANVTLNASITNARTAITNLQTANTTLNSSVTNLQTAVSNLQTANTTLNGSITNARTAITNLQTANTTLNTSITNARTAITNLQTANTTTNTSVVNLQTAVTNLQTANTTLNGSITNARTAISNLQTNNGTVNASVINLQSVVASIGNFSANNASLCRSDGTNCPSGITGSGWQNTTTQVWLSNNASNVTVSNTTTALPLLFVDSTNKRVGLGTFSPDQLLTVNGSINISGATGNLYINSGSLILGGTTRISSTGVGTFASSTTVNGQNVCLADGTNCPASGGGGWANTSTLIYTLSNSTNVSIGNTTANVPVLFVDTANDRIGIRTPSPQKSLHINTTVTTDGILIEGSSAPTITLKDQNLASDGAYFSLATFDGSYFTDTKALDTVLRANTGNIRLGYGDQNSILVINASRYVGINVPTPTSALHVNGSANITGNIAYGGNLTGYGADLAELVHSIGALEPGDVVVLSASKSESVELAKKAYDTRVAGIVSTAPSHLMSAEEGDVPLALAGRVPVKVTAENGAILAGDLLTTSNTPGKAMRCESRTVCSGAIVGKAMEPLAAGEGVITALVVLG